MSDKLTLLYVEDSEADYELFKMCIERYPFRHKIVVEHTETVEEGKALYNAEKHSAVILDWNLPDGNGGEVAQYIRDINSSVPIHFLSGSISALHKLAAEQYSASSCKEKNFNKKYIEIIYSFL